MLREEDGLAIMGGFSLGRTALAARLFSRSVCSIRDSVTRIGPLALTELADVVNSCG